MKKILFGLLGLLWAIPSWANCNLFNGYNSAAVTLDETNNVLSNKVRDTRTNFQLQVQMQKTDNSYFIPINQADIATGKQTFTFNVPEDIKYFAIKHNGVTQDIKITPDTLLPSAGTYTLSFDVLSNDPTIVGGLQLQNIKLERGSTATLYTPYDANCVERCANLYNYSYRNSEHYELVDGNTLKNLATDTANYFTLQIYDVQTKESYLYKSTSTPGKYNLKFTVPNVDNRVSIYYSGKSENLVFFKSQKINPGEYVLSFDLLSANPSVVGGLQLKNISLQPAYCSEIQVATTKYVETQFGDLGTRLAAAVNMVNTVVTNTINQAASIATLQSGKQTRPADKTECPAGKKCLLVEGTDGQPHWYEIVENAWSTDYTKLQYISSSGTQWINTGYVLQSDDITFEWTAIDKPSNNTSLFGSEVSSNPQYSIILYGSSTARSLYIANNSALVVGYASNDSDFHSWVLSVTSDHKVTLSKDGVRVGGANWSGNIQKQKSIGIFENNHQNQIASLTLKSFSITDGGVLVRNMIPMKRKIDNAVGLYDLVNDRFYTNAGTGTFIDGPVAE